MAQNDIERLRNFRMPAAELSPDQRLRLGARAIQVIKDRIENARDVSDGAAAPYSPRGPIYIPLTYGATYKTAGAVRVTQQSSRTVRELKGRYTMKRTEYLKHLQNLGYNVKVAGRITNDFRFLKTAKFADYSEFKQAIGHSGQRDLTLSGKMLGSIAVVRDEKGSVEIGFTRAEEEQKMRGNDARSPQWGFSASDREAIGQTFFEILEENLGKVYWP